MAVPVASAETGAQGHASITNFEKKQNKRIKRAKRKAAKAHTRIENLKDWNFDLDAHNRRQDGALNTVQDILNTLVGAAPQLIGGLQALQAALEDDVAPALTAINDALTDPTTGLVGLNLARPQFAALAADADFLGGTGAAGGQGPVDDSDTFVGANLTGVGGPDLEGTYVVDFNNDVSSRMYSVNVFPAGPGVATPTGSAANCSVSGIDTLCGLVQSAGPPDADPNKVLIQINDGDTPHPAGFSVTAISG